MESLHFSPLRIKCCVSSLIRSAIANRDERRMNAAASVFTDVEGRIFLGDRRETRRGVSAKRAAKRIRMAVRAMGFWGAVVV
jgi:hypothetical protein